MPEFAEHERYWRSSLFLLLLASVISSTRIEINDGQSIFQGTSTELVPPNKNEQKIVAAANREMRMCIAWAWPKNSSHEILPIRPAYFDMIYRYQLCYLDISI
jgi:hypothetical protein